jgi:hypothetical protein
MIRRPSRGSRNTRAGDAAASTSRGSDPKRSNVLAATFSAVITLRSTTPGGSPSAVPLRFAWIGRRWIAVSSGPGRSAPPLHPESIQTSAERTFWGVRSLATVEAVISVLIQFSSSQSLTFLHRLRLCLRGAGTGGSRGFDRPDRKKGRRARRAWRRPAVSLRMARRTASLCEALRARGPGEESREESAPGAPRPCYARVRGSCSTTRSRAIRTKALSGS